MFFTKGMLRKFRELSSNISSSASYYLGFVPSGSVVDFTRPYHKWHAGVCLVEGRSPLNTTFPKPQGMPGLKGLGAAASLSGFLLDQHVTNFLAVLTFVKMAEKKINKHSKAWKNLNVSLPLTICLYFMWQVGKTALGRDGRFCFPPVVRYFSNTGCQNKHCPMFCLWYHCRECQNIR